ncbi:hypothetical protein [Mesorhizobium sp. M0590]|uniref:hypothetical protein n=1 Tax=Mesorhizobium sp. M0590 TaxID=2956966 RepID=UPI0033351A4F
MMVWLGAVRDLIEAGLSERVGAATRYGISVATPVPSGRLGVMQCCHVGEDEAETPPLSEAIDVPVGIFGRTAGGNASALRADREDDDMGSLRPSTLMPRRCHDRCWGDILSS